MTFIPAENDPERRRPGASASGEDQTPTAPIKRTSDSISASADPNVTRPMPAVSAESKRNRYDLSPDPATAPIDAVPWDDRQAPGTTDPSRSGLPAESQATAVPRDTAAQGHHEPQPATQPYPAQSVGPAQGRGTYPGQVGQLGPAGHPGQAGPYSAAQPEARRQPKRDLSVGIFLGQLLRAVILLGMAGGIAYYALRTVGGQWADELALQEGGNALAQLPAAWVPWIDLIPVAACVFWGVCALFFALGTGRWVPLLMGMLSGLGAIVSVQVLKRIVLNKAPLGIQETAMNSLPSGHTAAAATAAMIAVFAAGARWRGAVAFFAALTTSLAGISTILNGWHRPMDAMVSVLLVAFWAVLGALLLRCLIRPEPWTTNLSVTTLVFSILLIVAAGAGLAAMQTLTTPGLALVTGSAGVIGFSLLGAHQTVRALRPRLRVP